MLNMEEHMKKKSKVMHGEGVLTYNYSVAEESLNPKTIANPESKAL